MSDADSTPTIPPGPADVLQRIDSLESKIDQLLAAVGGMAVDYQSMLEHVKATRNNTDQLMRQMHAIDVVGQRIKAISGGIGEAGHVLAQAAERAREVSAGNGAGQ